MKFSSVFTRHMRMMNAKVYIIHQSKFSTKGVPDRWVRHARWQGWVELKQGRDWLSVEQRDFIVESRFGTACVLRDDGYVWLNDEHSYSLEWDYAGKKAEVWRRRMLAFLQLMESLHV